MLLEELVLKGHVGGFREHALFFENTHDPQRFLDEFDRDRQIHSEIDHGPLNAYKTQIKYRKLRFVTGNSLLKMSDSLHLKIFNSYLGLN